MEKLAFGLTLTCLLYILMLFIIQHWHGLGYRKKKNIKRWFKKLRLRITKKQESETPVTETVEDHDLLNVA